jgi:hypothetical protein
MTRPSLVLVALALVLGACAHDTPVEAVSTSVLEASSTTAAPPTTTTTAAATDLATSTDAPSTIEAATVASEAPVIALTSFRWQFDYTVASDPANTVSVGSSGVFSHGDFDCTISTQLGDGSVRIALTSIDGALWLDQGSGPEPAAASDQQLLDATGLCPGSQAFWIGIIGAGGIPAGGIEETHNGIETRRVDLTSVFTNDRPIGFGDGMVLDSVTYWIALEGDWIEAIEMTAGVDPAIVASVTGTTSTPGATATVSVVIESPNDESLTVTAP